MRVTAEQFRVVPLATPTPTQAQAQRGEIVVAQQPGRHSAGLVPAYVRRQQLEMAAVELQSNTGGNPQTKQKAEQWRQHWEEAMTEGGFPDEHWYQFSVDQFRFFSRWALCSTNLSSLDVYQTMLNSVHQQIFSTALLLGMVTPLFWRSRRGSK